MATSALHHLTSPQALVEFAALLKELTGIRCSFLPLGGNRWIGLQSATEDNRVCGMLYGCDEGRRRCRASDAKLHGQALATRSIVRHRCHAGFLDIAVPIVYQEEVVGIVEIGQLLPEPPSEVGFRPFRKLAQELGLPVAEIREAYFSAPYLEAPRVQAAVRLVAFFANHLRETHERLEELEEAKLGPLVMAACQYIAAHLREDLSQTEVAAAAGCSPGHLSERFRQVMGMSYTEYVQGQRLARVERALRNTAEPITQVALAAGFGSLSQFNRVFRQHHGCTPREFRKRHSAREGGSSPATAE